MPNWVLAVAAIVLLFFQVVILAIDFTLMAYDRFEATVLYLLMLQALSADMPAWMPVFMWFAPAIIAFLIFFSLPTIIRRR